MSVDLKLDSDIEEVTSETHATGWTEKLGTFFEKALSATQNTFGTTATRDATTEQGAGASGKIPILDSGGKIPEHYAVLDYLNFASDSFADEGLLKEDFQLKTLSFREFGNATINFEKFNIKGTPIANSIVSYNSPTNEMEWIGNTGIIGEVRSIAHETTVAGWIDCDGRSLSRTTYSKLFAAIGNIYGSIDNDHFNIPDCRGRIIIGSSDSKAIGNKGGVETIILNTDQIPSHSHIIAVNTGTRADIDRFADTNPYLAVRGRGNIRSDKGRGHYLLKGVTNNVTTGSTDIIGESEPITIMQPYMVMSARIYAGI